MSCRRLSLRYHLPCNNAHTLLFQGDRAITLISDSSKSTAQCALEIRLTVREMGRARLSKLGHNVPLLGDAGG